MIAGLIASLIIPLALGNVAIIFLFLWVIFGVKFLIFGVLLGIAAIIMALACHAGYYRYCADLYCGRKTSISTIFQTAKEKWLSAFMAGIIIIIIISIIDAMTGNYSVSGVSLFPLFNRTSIINEPEVAGPLLLFSIFLGAIAGSLGISSLGIFSAFSMIGITSTYGTINMMNIIFSIVHFIAWLFLVFTIPAIVVEDRSIMDAVSRSVSITCSKFVKIFLLFSTVCAFSLILALIPRIGIFLFFFICYPLLSLLPISILKEK